MKIPQKIREAKTRSEKLHHALDFDALKMTETESFVSSVFAYSKLSHPHPLDPPQVKHKQKILPILKNQFKQRFADLFFDALWNDKPEEIDALAEAMRAKKYVRSGIAISDRKLAKDGIAFLPKGQYPKPDLLRAEILSWTDGGTVAIGEAEKRLEKLAVTNPAIKVPTTQNLTAIMIECHPERKRSRVGRPKILK